jgi:hypothetical protein
VTCHAPDGIAPFAFTSYDDTKGYAGLMAAATAPREQQAGGQNRQSMMSLRSASHR